MCWLRGNRGVDGGLAAAITARDSSTDRTDRSESYDEAEDEESEGHVRSGRFGSQWNNDNGLDETDVRRLTYVTKPL